MRIRLILFILMMSSSFSTFAVTKQCDISGNKHRSMFALEIYRSFGFDSTYIVCKRGDALHLQEKSSEKDSALITIELTKKQYDVLITKFDNAMNFNTKDTTLGFDGSTWCLETDYYASYIKACFWAPKHNSKERNLDGLLDLGSHLMQVIKNAKSV